MQREAGFKGLRAIGGRSRRPTVYTFWKIGSEVDQRTGASRDGVRADFRVLTVCCYLQVLEA